MSNMHGALHIKYRPTSLDGVIGNATLIKSLRGILKRKHEDRPRAYLLHGPSGCGKTTVARILATEFGASGLDFTEIDIADYRGIDTIRKLRERIQLQPMEEGGVKAYILDEAHMLTKEAQTALLKSLEDTPEHVVFFLCTTEPEKLLLTIRNRCHQFAVSVLSEEDINDLLKRVADIEDKKTSRKARQKIASSCQGSPRLALTMLDGIIDLPRGEQEVAVKTIEDQQKVVIDLCRAMVRMESWNRVKSIISELRKTSEPEEVRRAVLGYFTSVLLGNNPGTAYLVLDAFSEPTYDTGWAGIATAAWLVCNGD